MKLPIEVLRQVQQMLNAIPFMSTLDQKAIEELAYQLNQRHFMKGETIIREGEPGKLFHLVTKGRVGVFRKAWFRSRRLATLGPGEFFGEVALIDNVPRTATVVGEEDGEMFTLSRDAFESVLLANPRIGEMIRKTAAARVSANRNGIQAGVSTANP